MCSYIGITNKGVIIGPAIIPSTALTKEQWNDCPVAFQYTAEKIISVGSFLSIRNLSGVWMIGYCVCRETKEITDADRAILNLLLSKTAESDKEETTK